MCDDEWDHKDAAVVCRYLGFYGGIALENNVFGSGMGTIWLDELGCTGEESALEFCTHNGWGYTNCGHSEDAAVSCGRGPFA